MTKKLDNLVETYTDWVRPNYWIKAGANENIRYEDWCKREVERRTAAGQPCCIATNNEGMIAVVPPGMEN